MGKVSIHAQLSKALRKALGDVTQAELAAKLLVSRNYISQIEADLKTPSPRLVAQMEALLTEVTDSVSKRLKAGLKPTAVVEEEAGRFGMVASKIPQPRTPSTRQDCEDYVQQLFDAAEASDNPNAFPVIHDLLTHELPLNKWLPKRKPD